MRHETINPFAKASAHWSTPKLKSVPLTPEEVRTIVNADDPSAALIEVCRQRELIVGD
ncbi:hypothetical protein [Sphingomonas glaciei]|uniref:Uncharacterized protein n=1 Tax=Sphingomonas glaciei TaxID=2938948 RepID=A0ABY5MY46_9SPHN|nr:hypothetical protein [Sphingomonas glaciei]UUR08252.1 hypothetical protein M1K48_00975 [Sphingomonas glaciei]